MPGQHFETGNFKKPTKKEYFLPNEEYGRALRALVISTCDIAVLNSGGKLLLAKRTWEPAKGQFWIIGGRRIPGESFGESALRNLKHELGIEVTPARFQYLGGYSMVFAKRRQAPKQDGVHTDSTVMIVHLSEQEMTAIEPNEEYSETQWFVLQDVVKRSSEFHPAIVQISEDLLAAPSQGSFSFSER